MVIVSDDTSAVGIGGQVLKAESIVMAVHVLLRCLSRRHDEYLILSLRIRDAPTTPSHHHVTGLDRPVLAYHVGFQPFHPSRDILRWYWEAESRSLGCLSPSLARTEHGAGSTKDYQLDDKSSILYGTAACCLLFFSLHR